MSEISTGHPTKQTEEQMECMTCNLLIDAIGNLKKEITDLEKQIPITNNHQAIGAPVQIADTKFAYWGLDNASGD